MKPNQLLADKVKDFILAGNAHFTVLNTATDNQRKFHVKRSAPQSSIWFVTATDSKTPIYLGIIRSDTFIKDSQFKSELDGYAKDHIVNLMGNFQWLWKVFVHNQIPPGVVVLHHGQCGMCNRQLTDATSIMRGIGPQCAKALGIISPSAVGGEDAGSEP